MDILHISKDQISRMVLQRYIQDVLGLVVFLLEFLAVLIVYYFPEKIQKRDVFAHGRTCSYLYNRYL